MKIKLIFAGLSVLLLLSACSKYEEGPFISLKSPEKRLLGLWEITELMVDTANYISNYNDSATYVKFSIIEYDDMFINVVKEARSGSQLSTSLLTLEDGKKKMRFELKRFTAYQDMTQGIYELIPPLEFDNEWTILRLKSDEFIITLTDNSINYRITFGKLEKY